MITSPPNILFKYQRWDYPSEQDINKHFGKRIITDREIYFCSPSDFNDPYDSESPIVLNDLTATQLYYSLKKRDFVGNRNVAPAEIARAMEKARLSAPSNRDEFFDLVRELYREKVKDDGVFCLSENENSNLMWSHYADCHKGYCVGFDTKKLVAELQPNWRQPFPLEVTYGDTFPEIHCNDLHELCPHDIKLMYTHKYSDWKYEKEWRIILMLCGGKSAYVSTAVFDQIIFGFRMPIPHRNAIMRYLYDFPNRPKLFEAMRINGRYDLHFQPLDYKSPVERIH